MKNFTAQKRMLPFALASAYFSLTTGANAQVVNRLLEIRSDNPEIVITSNRQAQKNLTTPGTVAVITRLQIQESGAASINEAIMKLAGVIGAPSLFGGAEYSLDLAGFGDAATSNTIFVVDGIPLREADQSEVRISSIPLETIERIEIQRGSGTVLYGEGASAGVINIITRGSTAKSTSGETGSASLAVGSFGAQEIRANLSKSLDAMEINIAGVDLRSDGYRKHSKNQTLSGQLSLKSLGKGFRWGLNASREEMNAQTPGALSLKEFILNQRQAQDSSLANDTRMKMDLERFGAFAETQIGELKLRADLSHKTRFYDAISVLYGARTPLTFDTTSDYLGLSARHTHYFPDVANSLIFGFDSTTWDQSRVYPTQPNWGTVLLDSKAKSFYLKNEADIESLGIRFSLGWREESFKRNQLFTGVNSRSEELLHAWDMGISKTITTTQSAYLRYSKGYRVPNLDEFTTPAYDSSFAPINLVPQTEHTREIGWKYFESTKSSAGVRLYRSSLRNEIVYDPEQYGNINLAETRRQGADIYAQQSINSQLNLMASIGLRQSTNISGSNAGKLLPLAARKVVSLRADWQPKKDHKIGLGWMYVGRQFISGDFMNEQSMPSYSLLDLRYGYRVGSWELSGAVRNLTNRKYYSYATTTNGYSVYPDPGRSLMLTAKYRF